VCDYQVVLNSSISKTSKIRVFNNVTLVALSRLYGWGSASKASKAGKAAGKKWQARPSEAFQFTSVCVCLFFVSFCFDETKSAYRC